MGVLKWFQSKFSRKQGKRCVLGSSSPPNTDLSEHEEFVNSLQSFLAIGTLNTDELNEDTQRMYSSENKCSSQNLIEFALEEVVRLDVDDPGEFMASKTKHASGSQMEQNHFDAEYASDLKFCYNSAKEDSADLSPNNEIILNAAQSDLSDNRNTIKRKSIQFLLKKILICRNGFSMSPKLKDPIPESRMDKLFKAIIRKKIHHQQYLEKKKGGTGDQWVRTDSEFIVLEMKATEDV